MYDAETGSDLMPVASTEVRLASSFGYTSFGLRFKSLPATLVGLLALYLCF